MHASGARDRGIESRGGWNKVLPPWMREVAGSIPGSAGIAAGMQGPPVERPNRCGKKIELWTRFRTPYLPYLCRQNSFLRDRTCSRNPAARRSFCREKKRKRRAVTCVDSRSKQIQRKGKKSKLDRVTHMSARSHLSRALFGLVLPQRFDFAATWTSMRGRCIALPCCRPCRRRA